MTRSSRRIASRTATTVSPHAARSDTDLMAELVAGDDRALDELIHRYGARVRTYLGFVVRDDAWADDLTQEVFIRVHDRARSYDPRWPVVVWLLRISRNLAIDLLRREEVRERAVDPRKLRQRRAAPTADVVERREFYSRLHSALAVLPEAFRSVFVLRELDNLSYEAIAAITNTSTKTVSTRLHRARARLRTLLAPYLDA